MRPCNKCGVSFPIEDFPKESDYKDGHTGTCRDCTRKYHQRWTASHLESRRKSQREWAQAHKHQLHSGFCALCGSTPKPRKSGNGDNFDLDHDHKTGKTRGFLCRGCNLMIGLIERPNIDLQKIIMYLNKN